MLSSDKNNTNLTEFSTLWVEINTEKKILCIHTGLWEKPFICVLCLGEDDFKKSCITNYSIIKISYHEFPKGLYTLSIYNKHFEKKIELILW